MIYKTFEKFEENKICNFRDCTPKAYDLIDLSLLLFSFPYCVDNYGAADNGWITHLNQLDLCSMRSLYCFSFLLLCLGHGFLKENDAPLKEVKW